MSDPIPSAPGEDGDLTRLLNASPAGSDADRGIDALYARCREIVRRVKARNSGAHGLGTTDLLHRAWERTLLVNGGGGSASRWNSREHFFATLARATIESIIDERRYHLADKRGGGTAPRHLGEWDAPRAADGPPSASAVDFEDRAALGQALDEFASIDPRACTVVVLRIYWGIQIADIAASLGVSERSVNRDWLAARAWLSKRIGEIQGDPAASGGSGAQAPFEPPPG